MTRAFLLGVGASIALLGCGGIAVFDDGQGGDAATATSGTASRGSSRAASGSTRVSTAGPASVQNSAVVGTPADPNIVPTIERIELFADCQPELGPDPLNGTIEVSYTNFGGSNGITSITAAQIAFANPMEAWVFPLTLDPVSSGVVGAGETTLVLHKKIETQGDSSFICNLCGQNATVSLTYDNGSQAFADSPVFCGF